MSIREIAQNFHNCPKYIPPLSEFSHCLCPHFPIAFARISGKSNGNFGQKAMANSGKKQWQIRAKAIAIRAKAIGNSGKSYGKIWQKQWENSKSGGIYFGQKLLLQPEFPIAFARIFYCSFPVFPIAFAEFPTAFARISHCFCPNFLFSKMGGGGGGAQCPLPPPPRLLRLCVRSFELIDHPPYTPDLAPGDYF